MLILLVAALVGAAAGVVRGFAAERVSWPVVGVIAVALVVAGYLALSRVLDEPALAFVVGAMSSVVSEVVFSRARRRSSPDLVRQDVQG